MTTAHLTLRKAASGRRTARAESGPTVPSSSRQVRAIAADVQAHLQDSARRSGTKRVFLSRLSVAENGELHAAYRIGMLGPFRVISVGQADDPHNWAPGKITSRLLQAQRRDEVRAALVSVLPGSPLWLGFDFTDPAGRSGLASLAIGTGTERRTAELRFEGSEGAAVIARSLADLFAATPLEGRGAAAEQKVDQHTGD